MDRRSSGGSGHHHQQHQQQQHQLDLQSPTDPGATSVWVGSSLTPQSPDVSHLPHNDLAASSQDKHLRRTRSLQTHSAYTGSADRSDEGQYVVVSVRESPQSSSEPASRRTSGDSAASSSSSSAVSKTRSPSYHGRVTGTRSLNSGVGGNSLTGNSLTGNSLTGNSFSGSSVSDSRSLSSSGNSVSSVGGSRSLSSSGGGSGPFSPSLSDSFSSGTFNESPRAEPCPPSLQTNVPSNISRTLGRQGSSREYQGNGNAEHLNTNNGYASHTLGRFSNTGDYAGRSYSPQNHTLNASLTLGRSPSRSPSTRSYPGNPGFVNTSHTLGRMNNNNNRSNTNSNNNNNPGLQNVALAGSSVNPMADNANTLQTAATLEGSANSFQSGGVYSDSVDRGSPLMASNANMNSLTIPGGNLNSSDSNFQGGGLGGNTSAMMMTGGNLNNSGNNNSGLSYDAPVSGNLLTGAGAGLLGSTSALYNGGNFNPAAASSMAMLPQPGFDPNLFLLQQQLAQQQQLQQQLKQQQQQLQQQQQMSPEMLAASLAQNLNLSQAQALQAQLLQAAGYSQGQPLQQSVGYSQGQPLPQSVGYSQGQPLQQSVGYSQAQPLQSAAYSQGQPLQFAGYSQVADLSQVQPLPQYLQTAEGSDLQTQPLPSVGGLLYDPPQPFPEVGPPSSSEQALQSAGYALAAQQHALGRQRAASGHHRHDSGSSSSSSSARFQKPVPAMGHSFDMLSAAMAANEALVSSPPPSVPGSLADDAEAPPSPTPPPFTPGLVSPQLIPMSATSGLPQSLTGIAPSSSGNNAFTYSSSQLPPTPLLNEFPGRALLAAASSAAAAASIKRGESFNIHGRAPSLEMESHHQHQHQQQQRQRQGLSATSSLDHYDDHTTTTTSGVGSSVPSSPSDSSPTSPHRELLQQLSHSGDEGGPGAVVMMVVEPSYLRPKDKGACMRCGKKVYAMEKVGPVKDVLYHKACFTCSACHSTLSLKNFQHNEADLGDLNVYCISHRPSAKANPLDSSAVGIQRALTVPKKDKVNDQIRGGPEASRNLHLDSSALSIHSALNVPATDLAASIKQREGAWFRDQRKAEGMPPPDVARHDARRPSYEGSRSLYINPH